MSDENGNERDAEEDEEDEGVVRPHLAGLPDGAGCAECWEYLSEQREQARDDRSVAAE
ncbi:MAG: hypothetical protein ABEI31_10875 [Halodesulfurarchaeum sp.]